MARAKGLLSEDAMSSLQLLDLLKKIRAVASDPDYWGEVLQAHCRFFVTTQCLLGAFRHLEIRHWRCYMIQPERSVSEYGNPLG